MTEAENELGASYNTRSEVLNTHTHTHTHTQNNDGHISKYHSRQMKASRLVFFKTINTIKNKESLKNCHSQEKTNET